MTPDIHQRLRRINELLELLRNCGMQGRAQSYVQEIRELVAALQESPSDTDAKKGLL